MKRLLRDIKLKNVHFCRKIKYLFISVERILHRLGYALSSIIAIISRKCKFFDSTLICAIRLIWSATDFISLGYELS